MATNSKPTSLIIIIVILIISNVALGAAWWYSKNNPPKKMDRPSPMAAYLKKEVGFTAEQLVAFDSLRAQKRRTEKEIFTGIRNSKQDLFKNLGAQQFSDSAIQQTIDFAAEQQKILESNMMSSLKKVRALCTEEQRAKFDTGFYKAFIRNGTADKK